MNIGHVVCAYTRVGKSIDCFNEIFPRDNNVCQLQDSQTTSFISAIAITIRIIVYIARIKSSVSSYDEIVLCERVKKIFVTDTEGLNLSKFKFRLRRYFLNLRSSLCSSAKI